MVVLGSIFLLREKEFSRTMYLMDTVCEIKVIARFPPRAALDRAFAVMHRIDSLASFTGSGDIAKINRDEKIELSDEVSQIIKDGIKMCELTHGAFDITIRPLMELWGNFNSEHIPGRDEIEKVLQLVDYKGVEIKGRRLKFSKAGMQIDLSGIAKGYAVDLAVDELKRAGVRAGLVNAGGDIRVFGNKVWKIGVKDPRGAGVIKVIELKNLAVATSGDYEKYFIVDGVRYHHILNPRTGMPAIGCMSVSVICETAEFADALATGVFVLGPEKGIAILDSLGVPGLLITSANEFLESTTFSSLVK